MDRRTLALLETAIHPTANEGERANALSLFRGIVERGGGLEKVFATKTVTAPARAPYVPYSAQKAEITKLEGELRDRDARIAALEREIMQLRREKAAPVPRKTKIADDGSMSYRDFYHDVQRRLVNADRRWQMVFEQQTGLPRSRFPRFLKLGRVEATYVEAIKHLREVEPATRNEQAWTKAEVERVRFLTEIKKYSEKNIAAITTNEFGRRVTENMLKRLKLNSRDRVGVFRDPSYGGPIGYRRTGE